MLDTNSSARATQLSITPDRTMRAVNTTHLFFPTPSIGGRVVLTAHLAGTTSSTPCEDDQMQLIPHSPTEGVYPATDDYIHAMEVRGAERLLFVAGTMGLDPSGTPGTTLAEQLDLLWSNIRTILAAAGMTVDDIVRLTSYLRDASYAEANMVARVAVLNGRVVPTTAIVAETLVSDWLVEIEVVAAG